MLLFLVDLINIEIFRIPFNFFYSFYFILRSRATSLSVVNFSLCLMHAHFSPKSLGHRLVFLFKYGLLMVVDNREAK